MLALEVLIHNKHISIMDGNKGEEKDINTKSTRFDPKFSFRSMKEFIRLKKNIFTGGILSWAYSHK
jgi:hypothetical protein